MLYERWRQIVEIHADSVAFRDSGSGAALTFAELARRAEAQPVAGGAWLHPQGHSLDFILTVLAGWRTRRPVCPLEIGQPVPSLLSVPSDCAHLKFTSGSTGAPRGIVFSEAQLAADADHIVATMGLQPAQPNLGVISLAHSYGFSNLVTPLLLHGIPLVLVPSPLPDPLLKSAAGLGPLTLPAVPALWRAWHEAASIPSNIVTAISAGAPLPIALEELVHAERGLKLHNFYGASECGGIAYDRTSAPRREAGVVGTALRGVSLGIGPGGCLEIRGAAVGTRYWPEDEPEAALEPGCFRSSDFAEIGEGGEVRLLGRAADLINVAGRKLAPETVETALRGHPGVKECLVFGVPAPDDPRGEMVVACVEAPDVTNASMREHLARTLAAWQIPREWWRVESLPVGVRGKLSRAEWRARYERRSACPP